MARPIDEPNWITAALEKQFNLPFRYFHNPNVPIVPLSGKLAHHDLREYAQQAILPEMGLSPSAPPLPRQGRKSHANKLAIEHELYRHLVNLYAIDAFAEAAHHFTMANLPSEKRGESDVDADIGGGIYVPARGFKINSIASIGRASDINKVVRWVTEYPLAAVSHMMHLVYPGTADYTVQEGKDEDIDNQIFRWMKWGRDENTITEAEDTWSESVMVFVQPPWILSQADLEAFVQCPTFPAPNRHTKLKSHQRLWAKIWDLCTQKRSHWFVLTTYWGWVFGAFSAGRTSAFTSEIIAFDHQEPTVVQCLFFWFASALAPHLSPLDAWSVPEVPEPVDTEEDFSIAVHTGSVEIAESVSSWQARSNARSHTPSGIESDDEDAQTVQLALLGTHDAPANAMLPPRSRGFPNLDFINDWMEIEDIPPAPPSEAPSGTSFTTVSSASTVRDLAGQRQTHGAYMSGLAREPRLDYAHAGGLFPINEQNGY